MKKRLFFADFTHYNTGIISCDFFPLGCGYVASYAKSLFGADCDIEIFKFTDKFLKTIEKNPPDIFAASCYVWNRNLALLVNKLVKEANPDCLNVFGGLAFPMDAKRQKKFLLKNKQVDFFIPCDGEMGFANLLKKYFDSDGNKRKMKTFPAAGSVYLNDRGELITGEKTARPKDLDIFPSPYTTGLLDKFFEDGNFTPMIQTTRGCPYRCSYCWASNEENKCISFFSVERVKAELCYIAERSVKNNMYDLVICDSNFGLYQKDRAIVDKICELQQQYNYPRIFSAPYGKETTPDDVKYFSKMKGVTYCLSTQSTDDKILKNVNRKGRDLKKVAEYIKAVHETGKHIGTEIITGLPYETRETHMQTIRDLLDCGFDNIDPFTFMLLDGIELNTEEAHKKFKYDIRYRLIPRDFGKIKNNYVFEIEDVVVGTNTYTFEDYIYFRGFHGLLRILLNNDIYRELLQYLKQYNVHLLDWFVFVFDSLRSDLTPEAAKHFDEYIKETRSELWNSSEELIEFYSKEENYNKLLTRERGDNLMQKCSILPSSMYFESYVAYFIKMAKIYLKEKYNEKKGDIDAELRAVGDFILTRLSGVITQHIQKSKSFNTNYDILKWIGDGHKKPLSYYKLEKSKTITMELSDEQVKLIKAVFDRYGFDEKNPYALYRTAVLIKITNYFRKVKIGDKAEKTKECLGAVNES